MQNRIDTACEVLETLIPLPTLPTDNALTALVNSLPTVASSIPSLLHPKGTN